MSSLAVVIPVYNEQAGVVEATIQAVQAALSGRSEFEVVIVNDGSDPKYELERLSHRADIRYVSHENNRGYGAALKTGISSCDAEWIAITDADGTYPVADLPKLLALMDEADMVTGIRTGEISEIPLLRRYPKKMLNYFASLLAGQKIRDLNSGMRIFRRRLAYYLWGLFPSGFSFTSTITMGALMGDFRVKEIPINYYRREGSSSIKPIRDTYNFFRLVCRLGLLFAPKRLFTPVAILCFVVGLVKGLFRDYLVLGYVGNLSVTLIVAGVQIFMMGLIAQLIVLNRRLSLPEPREASEQPSQMEAEAVVPLRAAGE